MCEGRRCRARGFEDEDMFECIRQMILSADDMADAQVYVIGAGCHVIRGHPVAAEQREILNVGCGFRLGSVDSVCELNLLRHIAWHAVTHYERLACIRAAVAFLG